MKHNKIILVSLLLLVAITALIGVGSIIYQDATQSQRLTTSEASSVRVCLTVGSHLIVINPVFYEGRGDHFYAKRAERQGFSYLATAITIESLTVVSSESNHKFDEIDKPIELVSFEVKKSGTRLFVYDIDSRGYVFPMAPGECITLSSNMIRVPFETNSLP